MLQSKKETIPDIIAKMKEHAIQRRRQQNKVAEFNKANKDVQADQAAILAEEANQAVLLGRDQIKSILQAKLQAGVAEEGEMDIKKRLNDIMDEVAQHAIDEVPPTPEFKKVIAEVKPVEQKGGYSGSMKDLFDRFKKGR